MPLQLINLHSAVVKLPISAMHEIAGANGKGEVHSSIFYQLLLCLQLMPLGFSSGTRRLERHFNVTMRVTPLSRSRLAGDGSSSV
jgi:hypothetical protein